MQEIFCIYDKVPKYVIQFSCVFTRIEIQNALQTCLVVPKIGFYNMKRTLMKGFRNNVTRTLK